MKKTNILAALVMTLALSALTACSESEDTFDEFADWQERNENYFSNIYELANTNTDGTWKLIRNFSLEDTIRTDYDDYIAVQVIEEGTGSGCPMYTDSVRVSYRGRLMPSASYPDGYVFDQSYTGEYNVLTAMPTQFYVGGMVDGFTTALQHMHIGDHWRVYIPYNLAYGASSTSSLPAYSTLIFDIHLVSYYRANTSTGSWTIDNQGRWVRL